MKDMHEGVVRGRARLGALTVASLMLALFGFSSAHAVRLDAALANKKHIVNTKLQVRGNIEFFAREKGTTSWQSAETVEEEGTKPYELLALVHLPGGGAYKTFLFPLGANNPLEHIDSAREHPVLDTRSRGQNQGWKSLVENLIRRNLPKVDTLSFDGIKEGIIDGAETVDVRVRRKDEAHDRLWSFNAKNPTKLSFFDFSVKDVPLELPAKHDPDKLLPSLYYATAWPNDVLAEPAFFRDAFVKLHAALENPATTLDDLRSALNQFTSAEYRYSRLHSFDGIDWPSFYREWWEDMLFKKKRGEEIATFLVSHAFDMPVRELLSKTGLRLPWLDALAKRLQDAHRQWARLEHPANEKEAPKWPPNGRPHFFDAEGVYGGRGHDIVGSFVGLMDNPETKLDEVLDLLGTRSYSELDKWGTLIRKFSNWSSYRFGNDSLDGWVEAAYANQHRGTVPLRELARHSPRIRTLVKETIDLVRSYAQGKIW